MAKPSLDGPIPRPSAPAISVYLAGARRKRRPAGPVRDDHTVRGAILEPSGIVRARGGGAGRGRARRAGGRCCAPARSGGAGGSRPRRRPRGGGSSRRGGGARGRLGAVPRGVGQGRELLRASGRRRQHAKRRHLRRRHHDRAPPRRPRGPARSWRQQSRERRRSSATSRRAPRACWSPRTSGTRPSTSA